MSAFNHIGLELAPTEYIAEIKKIAKNVDNKNPNQ